MYKYSNYNYFYPIGNDIVLLNLINRNIITISSEKFTLISTLSPLDLERKNPYLFSLLRKLGYVIQSGTDEFKLISFEYNKLVLDNNSYRLTINPTLNCNFSCWYCYEEHNQGVMTLEMSNNVLKHIKNRIENSKISFLQIDWFGGEPMICFDSIIYPLSKKIRNLCIINNVKFHNQITTNGYLINQDHLSKFNEIELKQFQITLDGNEDCHNKVKVGKDSYRKTVKNIIDICKSTPEVNMLVRINYSNDNITTVTDIINDFPSDVRPMIKINFQKIWQYKDNNSIDELNEIKNKFRTNGFGIQDYYIDRIPLCYADKNNQAVINYDGLVYKCTARDFIKKNSDGHLNNEGEIVWNQAKLIDRFGSQPFDNDKCRDCDLLPACYGPCSQKVMETEYDNFQAICNYNGIKETINYLIRQYYEENFGKN